ncbi:hypothetical protein [Candidatus Harpocratesius sp.]
MINPKEKSQNLNGKPFLKLKLSDNIVKKENLFDFEKDNNTEVLNSRLSAEKSSEVILTHKNSSETLEDNLLSFYCPIHHQEAIPLVNFNKNYYFCTQCKSLWKIQQVNLADIEISTIHRKKE